MRGMSIVGPQEMPGLPMQTAIQDFNTLGNELFNQGKYREAISEYNKALGTIIKLMSLTVDFGPADPLVLWNRSAALVLLGKYRMFR
jgi:hypothetical protein